MVPLLKERNEQVGPNGSLACGKAQWFVLLGVAMSPWGVRQSCLRGLSWHHCLGASRVFDLPAWDLMYQRVHPGGWLAYVRDMQEQAQGQGADLYHPRSTQNLPAPWGVGMVSRTSS